jgi:hypothetical protein
MIKKKQSRAGVANFCPCRSGILCKYAAMHGRRQFGVSNAAL